MGFLIADTFTQALARLTGSEQKAVKIKAFDLQRDLANPGMQFHRIDGSRDPNFWSVRVNADLRVIVHKTPASLMLCYVGHHDDAYGWVERRRIERHPVTGAAQFVEVPTSIALPPDRPCAPRPAPMLPKPRLFSNVSDRQLLGYGVPAEWVEQVRSADEDTFFDILSHLPAEAADALIELAVGGTPKPRSRIAASIEPFSHPDARRRFRSVGDRAGLEEALQLPSAAPAHPKRNWPAASLASFEARWAGLRASLKTGAELRGWGAVRGFTNMRFRIDDVDLASVTVSSATMSAPRRVTKAEFAKVYRLWNDYCAGSIDRSAVTAISQNSSYIFAILRRCEDLEQTAGERIQAR